MVELLVAFPSTLPVHCPSHKFGKNLFEVMQCAPLLTQVERVKSFIIVSLSDCFLFYHKVSLFSVFYKIFLKTNEHQHNVVSWPQNRTENGSVTNSLKEININRVLFVLLDTNVGTHSLVSIFLWNLRKNCSFASNFPLLF